jgi:hypothetical protein
MARRYASAGRGDVQVRLDFDQGDGEGCSLMGSLPPSSRAEAHYSYGSRIVDDERGEEYMELDGDEGEDEGSVGGNGSGKGAIKNIQASDLIESLARDMSSDHVFNLPLRTKTIIGKFNWD